MTRRPSAQLLIGAVLVVALAASAVVVIGIGPVSVPPDEVISVVARRFRLIEGRDVTVLSDNIVWQLRMPRIVATVMVGASLAQCGCVLQSLTRNELADPYLLGISSGAAVGAVMSIVLGLAVPFVPARYSIAAMAFVGALAALLLVLALATGRSGELPAGRTILAGVAIAQVSGAVTAFLIMVAGQSNDARQVLSWMLGSFSGVRAHDALLLSLVCAAAVLVLTGCAHTLDAFAFGDVSAHSLGVDANKVRWMFLIGCALLTAASVAVVGPIGFVGLVVPHVVRLLVGPGHRGLLPLSALAGAVLMVWADTAARTLGSGRELPVGVVTAVVGTPVLVLLLRRQARRT